MSVTDPLGTAQPNRKASRGIGNDARHRKHGVQQPVQMRCEDVDLNDEIPDYPPPTFQEAISMSSPKNAASVETTSDCLLDSDDDGSLEIIGTDSIAQYLGESAVSPRRRHLSLRTLFPFRPSAQSKSLYSRNAFFRSTTSLRTMSSPSFMRLPLSASSPSTPTRTDFMSIFGSKGKEKARTPGEGESLDSWEILDSVSAVHATKRAPSHVSVMDRPGLGCPGNARMYPISSPLSVQCDGVHKGVLERAMQVPLPQTPVVPSPILVNTPAPPSTVFSAPTHPRITHESRPNNRHHYRGRPLPRPPLSTNQYHIDSTYACSEPLTPCHVCPEGLLIDFDTPAIEPSLTESTIEHACVHITDALMGMEEADSPDALNSKGPSISDPLRSYQQPRFLIQEGEVTIQAERAFNEGGLKMCLARSPACPACKHVSQL